MVLKARSSYAFSEGKLLVRNAIPSFITGLLERYESPTRRPSLRKYLRRAKEKQKARIVLLPLREKEEVEGKKT